MAPVYIKYQSAKQLTIMIQNTERLCTFLAKDGFEDEADHYMKTVKALKSASQLIRGSSDQGPELPRRESLMEKDKIKIKVRFDKENSVLPSIKSNEATSDDDNDEIYNYHKSVMVQVHATYAENLARFDHDQDGDGGEDYDEIEKITESFGKLKTGEEKLDVNEEIVDEEAKKGTMVDASDC